MRTALTILLVFVLGLLSGCAPGEKGGPVKGKELLTVNFEQGRTLQYKFVSKRDTRNVKVAVADPNGDEWITTVVNA